jgi:endoglucanase
MFLGLVACGEISLYGQTTNAPPATASAPAAGSLVSNGDFALATKDPTWPDDWSKGKGITWETEGSTHFLRVVAQQPGQHLMVYREVPIPTGVKNLQITIKYRTSGIVVGSQNWMDARGIFHFIDDSRKNVVPEPHVLDFSKDADAWTVASESCSVPDGATKLVLMPSLFKVQAGTLDLAEITVTPVQ